MRGRRSLSPESDREALVAFLKALTDEPSAIAAPALQTSSR